MPGKETGAVIVTQGMSGIELPNLKAAHDVAVAMAKKIIAHDSAAGIYDPEKVIEISDETGKVLEVVQIKDFML